MSEPFTKSTWEKLLEERKEQLRCAKEQRGTPASKAPQVNLEILDGGRWQSVTATQLLLWEGVEK